MSCAHCPATISNARRGAAEPVARDNPLLTLANVLVTPHVTWYTADTMRRYLAEGVENCRRLHDGLDLVNLVNEVAVGRR